MFLITYPVSAFDGQMINHPNSSPISEFDRTKKEESMKVFLMLLAQFGHELKYYDMSISHFENIDKLIDDINCQEIDFENNWCVLLNLEENDIIDVLANYKRDFIIIKGDTKQPLRFKSDNKVIVYGEFEVAMVDLDESNGDQLHCLLSVANTTKNEVYIVHDFSFKFENVNEVATFKSSSKCSQKWFDDVSNYFTPKEKLYLLQ